MPSWCISFPVLNQSFVPCLVLTAASWPVYRVLRRQVRWSGIPISLRIFHSLLWSTIQNFGIVTKPEVDVFLELSFFLMIQWILATWFLVSLPSLNPAWTSGISQIFTELLKPGLENFKQCFARVWNECNCAVVWAFSDTAFLWDWKENWAVPVLWPLLSFPNFLTYWVQHFHSIIF